MMILEHSLYLIYFGDQFIWRQICSVIVKIQLVKCFEVDGRTNMSSCARSS